MRLGWSWSISVRLSSRRFGGAIESCLVAQVFQQVAVAEDACLETLQFADQGAARFRVFRIELADLRIEQFIEVERRPLRGQGRVRGAGVEPAPPFGLGPRHVGPTDLLGVVQDAGLDRFVFAGLGHGFPDYVAVFRFRKTN